MSVYHWEDPNLKPLSEKFLLWARDLLRDPYLNRLKHPNRIEALTDHTLARGLRLKDELSVYRRKYRGEFCMSDFFDSNKLRLLFLNVGELIALKKGPIGQEATAFSRNLLRGGLTGYALNGAYYMGTYGFAAQRASTSDRKFFSYISNLVLASVVLSPLHFAAMTKLFYYNNRSFFPAVTSAPTAQIQQLDLKSVRAGFSTFAACSMLFTTVFGTSIYLQNTREGWNKYLHLPLVALSYPLLSMTTTAFRAIESPQSVKAVLSSLSVKSISAPGFAFFIALNALMPIQLDQFKPKEHFANAHLDFVNKTEEFQEDDGPFL